MRSTDREMVAIEKTAMLTDPKSRRHATPRGATQGSARVGQEAEGAGGNVQSPYRGFPEKEWEKQGKQA